MKTNLPGRKLFLLVACVAIMALTLNSCRKDLLVANSKDIAMAQQWYQQRALTVKNYVYVKGGNLIPIEEKPDWGGAKKTVLGNGSSVIIVPLESNLFKATGQQGSLQLVIEEKQGEFRSRYVGSKNPETFEKPAKELFQMAFLDKQEPGQAKGSPSAAGGQYQSLQVNCTDWYLVTKVYVDDELVSVREEYLGTTCDGEFTGGGSGSNGDGNGDGNFGEDANCRNCVVSADNFLALKAYARAAGLTVYPAFASTLTLVDGTQYTGIFVEIRAANGTLVVTYFSPNENSSLFTTGYYYSIGNKGPSGTNNPPNIVSPNGAVWNFGATPSQVGGGWGSQSATYGRAPEFQHLINALGLSTTEVVFLDNLPKVVDALNIYLQTYGETLENKEFAKWAVGYLMDFPDTDINKLIEVNSIPDSNINIPNLDVSELNAYPAFKALVEDLPNFLLANPKILKALEATTGFSKAKIMKLMQPGKGPKVRVVNDLRDSQGNRVIGNFNRDINPNLLRIDAAYVSGLGSASNTFRAKELSFILLITTLHEFVHYGRATNDLSKFINQPGWGDREAGNYFEDKIMPPGSSRLEPETAKEWLRYYKIRIIPK